MDHSINACGMKQNNLPLALVLFLMTTVIQQESPFKQLYTLAGTWKMEVGGKSLYENWQITDTGEMIGKSYRVSATDTFLLEDVHVRSKQNAIYYIPVVTGQNGGQAVPFKLIASANQQFTFENPLHDFPQRVIYHLVNNDSLHAWIEGKQYGKEKRSDFYYRRVK